MRCAWLESRSAAGQNVQPLAPGGLAVEFKRVIDFGKVEMRADLHRPIRDVDDLERRDWLACVDLDIRRAKENLAGHHWPGFAGLAGRRLSGGVALRIIGGLRWVGWIAGCAQQCFEWVWSDGHCTGSVTVTSLVPSGNVAST